MEGRFVSRSSRQETVGAAFRRVNQITSIGTEIIVPVIGGWWLDREYGWAPVCLIVGACLGAILAVNGFRLLIRDLNK